MTKEEFLAKKKQLDDELREISRQQNAKREEIKKLRADYCHQMYDEYMQYKDKKVKVIFVNANVGRFGRGVERKECIGFLTGFSFYQSWNEEIYASIAKVKKDGTPSKIEFSPYDMLPWKDMQSIEVVE